MLLFEEMVKFEGEINFVYGAVGVQTSQGPFREGAPAQAGGGACGSKG
jgi:hypothetical protein